MAMNELLASHYGTNSEGATEQLEKEAQTALFAKLAAENGIDLNQLSDDQISSLWDSTFKEASDDDEDDKAEKAKKELDEKKEAMSKIAEADFLGRQMAHAYVDELDKIAGPRWDKVKGHASSAGNYLKSVAKGERARGAFSSLRAGADAAKGETKGPHIKHHGKQLARGIAETGAMYGGGGAAAYMGGKKLMGGKKKRASAIDEFAFDLAVEKAAEAGFNSEEAAERMDALFTLDAYEDSAKIASASDLNEAVEIRSLELLEGAGYPIEKEAGEGPGMFRRGAKAVGRFAKNVTGYNDIKNTHATRRQLGAVSEAAAKGKITKEEAEAVHKAVGKPSYTKGLLKATGTAAGATGAVYGAHKLSSLNVLAFDSAVEKAAEAGFDAEEAAQLVSAQIEAGYGDSDKLASADDMNSAVEIRSLELLEAVGYPVTWA